MILFHQWLNKCTIHWQLMKIYGLWNSINLLNFKTSLQIKRPQNNRHYEAMRTKSTCDYPLPHLKSIYLTSIWQLQCHNWIDIFTVECESGIETRYFFPFSKYSELTRQPSSLFLWLAPFLVAILTTGLCLMFLQLWMLMCECPHILFTFGIIEMRP